MTDETTTKSSDTKSSDTKSSDTKSSDTLTTQLDSLTLSTLSNLPTLTDSSSPITLRGFVSNQRIGKSVSFLTLRQSLDTIQCVYSKKMSNYSEATKIPIESFVQITGTANIVTTKIVSCTIQLLEIHIQNITPISLAHPDLPFSLKDSAATILEKTKRDVPIVSYSKCLDNRSLDLRTPHSQSIFRIADAFMFNFRSFLRCKDFIEIKTSKLIESSCEGGANMFRVDYFKTNAYLAQSPQLYKQMAVIGGMQRVYEIGHVYRAEESNINRYMSEFVGVDLEMDISTDHSEVIAMVYEMYVHLFDRIKVECVRELETIRAYQHFEDSKYDKHPRIFTFKECVSMLGEENVQGDMSRENERVLGEIVKEKYGVDFFVVKDYPTDVRAFYTKPMEGNESVSHSFDFIIRGEEICSGAQRISNYDDLVKSCVKKGVDLENVKGYLEAFKYGVPEHGGVGIGFERTMKAYFGFKDIRALNMFPRDPSRLYP